MNKKLHAEKTIPFTPQFGKDLLSIKDSKSIVVNLFAEVGMTDWEIHMNQTMLLLENNIKQPVSYNKVVEDNVELKNTRYSDYWLG